jgi:hypothetical protein
MLSDITKLQQVRQQPNRLKNLMIAADSDRDEAVTNYDFVLKKQQQIDNAQDIASVMSP